MTICTLVQTKYANYNGMNLFAQLIKQITWLCTEAANIKIVVENNGLTMRICMRERVYKSLRTVKHECMYVVYT